MFLCSDGLIDMGKCRGFRSCLPETNGEFPDSGAESWSSSKGGDGLCKSLREGTLGPISSLDMVMCLERDPESPDKFKEIEWRKDLCSFPRQTSRHFSLEEK